MNSRISSWIENLRKPGYPDEYETKLLLRAYGIPVPKSELLAADGETEYGMSPDWEELKPEVSAHYVLKVCSPEILHKTEEEGVLLDVDYEDLQTSVHMMREKFPHTPLLLEEQVRFVPSEFIIGALIDNQFGPAVMVGAGGVLTELYKDVAFRLIPCSRAEALRMLSELKIAPLLDGFRGMISDKEGLAEIIYEVGILVNDLSEKFSQLDINPIVFDGQKWIALDAKLILKQD